MKKLFLTLTFLSLQSFGETGLLKAPFAEFEFKKELTSAGRLVIPPMVAEVVYREAITEDCRQFQETVTKYSAHMTSNEVMSLVTAPLPYSMKKTYEVEVMFASQRTVSLAENGELHLHAKPVPLLLEWSEVDLLKDVLNPLDSIVVAESSSAQFMRLKFTRRDVFCGYIKEKLNLKIESSVFWKLSETQQKRSETNMNLLLFNMKPILSLEKGDKLMAALLGRTIHLVTSQPAFQAEKRFASVEYIWNLLFENENSLQKSALWTCTGSGVYLQENPAAIELKGLQ